MLIDVLSRNVQAYKIIWLMDHAVKLLFDWVYDVNPNFDMKLKGLLDTALANFEQQGTYSGIDEAGYQDMIGGAPCPGSRPWSLANLAYFIPKVSDDSKVYLRCFRTDKGLATKLASDVYSIIGYRNAVMHGQLFTGNLDELATYCGRILTQLRRYVGQFIESEGKLQLLTLTRNELLNLASETNTQQDGVKDITSITAGVLHNIELTKTWYPGHYDRKGIGKQLSWPTGDIVKYVSLKALTWQQVAKMSSTPLEKIARTLGQIVNLSEEAKVGDLENLDKGETSKWLLHKIKAAIPESHSVAWSAYRPERTDDNIFGRHYWPKNKSGHAHLCIWRSQ